MPENISSNTQGDPAFSEKNHAHVGPVLAVLVIILICILGGLYLWGSLLTNEAVATPSERNIVNDEPETTRAQADSQMLGAVSSSNALDAIYADLESTNLDTLDNELDQITRELEATLK